MMQNNGNVNFLMVVLDKVMREYKELRDVTRRIKPFKIVDIAKLSTVPGETQFLIQATNKNCILRLTAAELVKQQYRMEDFSDYHAALIQHAAQGTLAAFLNAKDAKPLYKIVSKRLDRIQKHYVFTIAADGQGHFLRSAQELSQNKALLKQMSIEDVYDIGFTCGQESLRLF